MKKLLIPFIASFGLSLGIATGVVMVRTPKPTAIVKAGKASASTPKSDSTVAHDSAAAPVTDSTAAVPGGQALSSDVAVAPGSAPSAQAADGKTETGPNATVTPSTSHDATAQQKTVKSNPPAAAAQGPNVKLASSTPSNTPKAVVPVVKPATDSLIGRRLAQVFGAMQPKDAARVLEQMDDNDVRAILGSLSSKQQAAILGSFPTQRAALILQATLRTASSGGTE